MHEFLIKNRWAVRPYAVLFLLLSPVLIPVLAVWEKRRELKEGYGELFKALRIGGKVFD